MDEIWTMQMLGPHFAFGDWSNRDHRFFVLHLMLICMDERDLKLLPAWVPEELKAAQPHDWLPFMSERILQAWQTLIYDQIKPGGETQTFNIFGERVGRAPEELQAMAHDEGWMQRELWDHVPRQTLAEIERAMMDHACSSLIRYLSEYASI
jgi:hypothetical protein